MKAKTEELAYHLFWTAETILRPTFRNITGSFESWAYRNGLLQQLAALEKAQLVESRGNRPANRIHRLTEAGRRMALGGCDPVTRWNRPWDGRWRMILFDVPQTLATARARLRKTLAQRGFGCLQRSVWITPDELTDERDALGAADIDVNSLVLLEARPCSGETDAQIVEGAWDFDAINALYDRHAAILDAMPQQELRGETDARRWQRWLREERLTWLDIATCDPFLPQVLHPAGYRGVKAWKRRLDILVKAGGQMRAFKWHP